MQRRQFVKLCGSALTLAASSALSRPVNASVAPYARAKLVDKNGRPIKTADLKVGVNYLFHYPFAGTPNFLLKLPNATTRDVKLATTYGQSYEWKGGVGPEGSIVAFSAICAHQLSYPSNNLSVINYRQDYSPVAERSGVIVCCAHDSVYDPAAGAKVLSGPARQPLAAIVLEYDIKTDELHANGIIGAGLFKEFFKAYKKELIKEFGRGVSRKKINDSAIVMRLTDYVAQQITC